MAVLSGGYIRGKITSGVLGKLVFQGRKGQQIIKGKPEPMHLKGVKDMSDEELAEWAKRHGMSIEDAKKIRSKQNNIKDVIDECNEEKEKDPAGFINKYKPRKEGETAFNVCVSEKLS